MNRLINFYSLLLHTTNWRPLILVSLLVAQKVWDDRYLCTADFATIYPFFSKDELVKLELKFLQLIEYNVQIKGSTYAKYYFELRSLFKDEVMSKFIKIIKLERISIGTDEHLRSKNIRGQKQQYILGCQEGSSIIHRLEFEAEKKPGSHIMTNLVKISFS